MNDNRLKGELILSLILIGLTILFINPLQKIWMPTMFMSMVLVGFIIAFILFAAFLWKEAHGDEREERHRLMAGRIGFLCGCGILVVGIILQSLNHTLDPWLLVSLCGMILAKLVARIYADTKN